MDPISIDIIFSDGATKTVDVIAVDLMRFEQHFDMSVAALNAPRLTHLFFLAWSVENRTKATDLDFDAWVATIQIVKEGNSAKK